MDILHAECDPRGETRLLPRHVAAKVKACGVFVPVTNRIDDPQKGAVLASDMPNSAHLRSLGQDLPFVVLGASSASVKVSFVV